MHFLLYLQSKYFLTYCTLKLSIAFIKMPPVSFFVYLSILPLGFLVYALFICSSTVKSCARIYSSKSLSFLTILCSLAG